MEVLENQQLRNYVSMRIGGPAKFVVIAKNKEDVRDACNLAREKNLPLVTIGTGTNVVFDDKGFKGIVLVNQITGFEIDYSGLATIGAGENWDSIVKKTLDAGFVGIESMSLIPGTAGATPVNNVGAYGQEISDTLISIEVLDTTDGTFSTFNKEDCEFSYRNSKFKTKEHGRYIICSLKLQLIKYNPASYKVPDYPVLTKWFEDIGTTNPTPSQVRSAVTAIRRSKLPDPAVIPNSGSFFKNPIVSDKKAAELLANYPDIPIHKKNGKNKVSGGWLIEKAGLRNSKLNGFWIYDRQALVLVNESANKYTDLKATIEFITKTIADKFEVTLEIEPELL